MAKQITLAAGGLKELRTVDERLVSYNIEFAEVTGGTFWKAYTPGQIEGTEPFIVTGGLEKGGLSAMMGDLMQLYDPINLYDEKLRKLAKDLSPAWVRVSGTWATKTYYDFDGTTGGKAPDGYLNVLSKAQWIGVLDFVKAVGAKLLVSVSNCPGLHSAAEPWPSTEAEKLFALSKEYGVPIDAAEFTNEPNMMEGTGFPAGYTAADYRRDQDLFFGWLDKNYPDCLKVGPSTTGGDFTFGKGGGVENLFADTVGCDDLMAGTKVPLDVFSYHYYNGCSERLAAALPDMHWSPEQATCEAYLDTAPSAARTYAPFRDKYVPGAPMWVTESGDAGGGGNTWASTYLDVIRTLNELGGFATVTNGVIFHNTLASSDYGFLAREVFDPRPNFFAVLLWNRMMGATVLDSAIPVEEGAHVYAHSRRDGKPGVAYCIINNSRTDTTTVALPGEAELYLLDGETPRAGVMRLNGAPLTLGEGNALPAFAPAKADGSITLPPLACAFVVV